MRPEPIPVCPILITASTSPIKTLAVSNVFSRYQVTLFAVHAESRINAQPVNGETYTGALNRIQDVHRQRSPLRNGPGYWVIAIENGIFSEWVNGQTVWSDRAVIIVEGPNGKQYRADTEPVTLPNNYVDTARARGFNTTTVGQVMSEVTKVTSSDDPHASVPPFRSRRDYLEKSLNGIATLMEHAGLITPKITQPIKALRA